MLRIDLNLVPKKYHKNLESLIPECDAKDLEERVEKNITKLKFTTLSDIQEIFSTVNPVVDIEYEEVILHPDREVVRILKPIEKRGQLFYKSTGTSRGDKSLKGIWFPFAGFEDGRLVKMEDRYVNAYTTFSGGVRYDDISSEVRNDMLDLIKNKSLEFYGRFIDYANASISATLSKF